VNNSTFTKDSPPTLPYRVGQAAKRQAKQLNAVLWRGGSLDLGDKRQACRTSPIVYAIKK
ncbi:MAG: hypothetical protein LBD47_04635, partial [Treponema sp.]|nr:hypothetical protein [Treponema sp.]